jgi:two-component system NtrC family sensor kinase
VAALKVLVADASDAEAERSIHELTRAGFDVSWRRVDSTPALTAALADPVWDVVLADVWLPGFTGVDALALVLATREDLPVIVVSGAVGEDVAVRLMRDGACDVVSRDGLARLGPAVTHVLREAESRHARRHAQVELRKMALVVEQIPSVVVITDLEGRIEYVNPRFTELTGYTREEVRGRNPRILKSGQTSPERYRELWETVRAGQEWRGLFHQRRKDGTTYAEEAVIRPMRDESGRITHYLKLGEDVTDKQALEHQFRHAQKMEAVGRLAGGVAHDFNNLLTVISGFTEMALAGLAPADPLRRDLEQIALAGERGAALTRQLLAFSRKQTLEPKSFSLGQVVRDAESMVRRLVGEDVTIDFRASADEGGLVMAEPGQIEQVLMNLVVNARDAMPSGGRLSIGTATVRFDAESAARRVKMKAGAYAVLTVADTGHGMDPETLSRIFEPFFTTKGAGRGTGLGLSTVYGIVRQAGGHIGVESEPGRGTTFTIYLPDAVSMPPRRDPAPLRTPVIAAGSATVLLVEDESAVRTLVRTVLTRGGYQVLEAADGEAALALARSHDGAIDLLLTDIVMPKMNGRDLASAVGDVRPGTRILFMSGYESAADEEDDTASAGAFIQKPFVAEALARKVRQVLDATA